MYRVSLKLHKGEEIKYLSHRDIIRAFEFALRRAKIPVAYSSGFNPRPCMSFGSAIGVGVTSDDERIVLDLASAENPQEVKERLNSTLPNGLQVLEAEVVPEGVKSPISSLNASEFEITVEGDAEEIGRAIDHLMSYEEIRIIRVREGKSKEIDIRPYLMEAGINSKDGLTNIRVSLRSTSTGGAGPRDFVQALRDRLPNLIVRRVHRLRQFHADS